MADSQTEVENVETPSLDDFEKDFFNPTPAVEVVDADEAAETEDTETPSATDGETVEEESDEVEETSEDGDDTPADETDDTEVEEVDEPKKTRRKPARERINELTREKRDLERRLAALEAAAIVRKEMSEEKPTPEPKSIETKATPSPDAVDDKGEPLYPLGEFDPHFIQALTAHYAEQAFAEKAKLEEEKARIAEAQKAEDALEAEWQERVKTSIERLPDLPEKVQELETTFRDLDPNYGNFLASTIMSLDNGPDVLDYLADNIEEAQNIVKMGATRAIVALGRLDARFEQKAPKVDDVVKGKTKTTQAPPRRRRPKGLQSQSRLI